jgi:hypothetical protein
MSSTAFQAGLKTVPYRKDYFAKLGDNPDKVNQQGVEWLTGVDQTLSILNPYMDSKKKTIGIKG